MTSDHKQLMKMWFALQPWATQGLVQLEYLWRESHYSMIGAHLMQTRVH